MDLYSGLCAIGEMLPEFQMPLWVGRWIVTALQGAALIPSLSFFVLGSCQGEQGL